MFKIMKSLRWILFIPVSLVVYFIAITGMAFIYSLIPSLKENPFLDYYIMPAVINIVGIFIYFSIGNAVIATKNEKTSNKVYIILSIIILIIQVLFLMAYYNGEEYHKIISSIVGCVVGALPLVDLIKNKKI